MKPLKPPRASTGLRPTPHTPHTPPTLDELHQMAARGLRLYAITKDPLTAHASQLIFQAASLPLNGPQQNAAIVLNKQLAAYDALYTEPLM